MCLRLQREKQLVKDSDLETFLATSNRIAAETIRKRDDSKLHKNISPLTSNFTAPCLIGAVAGRGTSSATEYFSEYLEAARYADNEMPNEALYGRVGYLSGLLTLSEAGCDVPEDIIRQVRLAFV